MNPMISQSGAGGLFRRALFCLIAVVFGTAIVSGQGTLGLASAAPRAHSHNDYKQPRPLLDALAQGFDSIEADVHLVDGRLLVAHEPAEVRPDRTLESLYLDPLSERAARNGGLIYPDGRTVVLLVDVKTDAEATYAALHAVLEKYASLLTTYRGDSTTPGAVTVIVSGNRARAVMAAQPVRFAALDGRAEDLATAAPAALVPLVSDNWRKFFTWSGEGPMPQEEKIRLDRMVAQAHAAGRWLRFWNTPETATCWQVLREAGVDFIGTGHLLTLRQFLDTP